MIFLPADPHQYSVLRDWIEKRVPHCAPLGEAALIACVRDGRILAVVAYNNLRGGNIELTFAADSPKWATRQTVDCMLGYAFRQVGVRRISALTSTKNVRAEKLLAGLGFKKEGILHDVFGEKQHASLYGMTRRWWQASKWNATPMDKAA